MLILKLKYINFITIKIHFLRGVDIDNILVFNKISFGEKNYKWFVDYFVETRIYVKSCNDQARRRWRRWFVIEEDGLFEK